MSSRYHRFAGRQTLVKDRNKLSSADKIYSNYLKDREVTRLTHFTSPIIGKVSPAEKNFIDSRGHIWSQGDKYYKLADEYYQDPDFWWIIAWFNLAPTEAHLNIGDLIQIPIDLETVLSFV